MDRGRRRMEEEEGVTHEEGKRRTMVTGSSPTKHHDDRGRQCKGGVSPEEGVLRGGFNGNGRRLRWRRRRGMYGGGDGLRHRRTEAYGESHNEFDAERERVREGRKLTQGRMREGVAMGMKRRCCEVYRREPPRGYRGGAGDDNLERG